MSLSLQNYIYNGEIRHRRFTPFEHFFSYPLFMVYVDISKVSTILKRSILWNVNKPAFVSFYRKDYHGNPSIPLDEAVRNTIYEKTGKKIGGKDGEYFLCLVLNFLEFKMDCNGVFLIIVLKNLVHN